MRARDGSATVIYTSAACAGREGRSVRCKAVREGPRGRRRRRAGRRSRPAGRVQHAARGRRRRRRQGGVQGQVCGQVRRDPGRPRDRRAGPVLPEQPPAQARGVGGRCVLRAARGIGAGPDRGRPLLLRDPAAVRPRHDPRRRGGLPVQAGPRRPVYEEPGPRVFIHDGPRLPVRKQGHGRGRHGVSHRRVCLKGDKVVGKARRQGQAQGVLEGRRVQSVHSMRRHSGVSHRPQAAQGAPPAAPRQPGQGLGRPCVQDNGPLRGPRGHIDPRLAQQQAYRSTPGTAAGISIRGRTWQVRPSSWRWTPCRETAP